MDGLNNQLNHAENVNSDYIGRIKPKCLGVCLVFMKID